MLITRTAASWNQLQSVELCQVIILVAEQPHYCEIKATTIIMAQRLLKTITINFDSYQYCIYTPQVLLPSIGSPAQQKFLSLMHSIITFLHDEGYNKTTLKQAS